MLLSFNRLSGAEVYILVRVWAKLLVRPYRELHACSGRNILQTCGHLFFGFLEMQSHLNEFWKSSFVKRGSKG